MNLIPYSWWKRFVALNQNPFIHPFTSFPQAERTVIHTGVINSLIVFYDNSTNSRALIGYFLSLISRQTHEFIIYAMSFHSSVLL